MCGWCSDREYPLFDLLRTSTLLSLFVETSALPPPQRLDDAIRTPFDVLLSAPPSPAPWPSFLIRLQRLRGRLLFGMMALGFFFCGGRMLR